MARPSCRASSEQPSNLTQQSKNRPVDAGLFLFCIPASALNRARFAELPVLSFRMISDTRIECQNANSRGETARFGPAGAHRSGVEPGSAGAIGLDGFLSAPRQRGPHLPSLWHQPPDVLSLAVPL